jgi:hypothetical protein
MPKVGRFVVDPGAGADCQVTLDNGEKILVSHDQEKLKEFGELSSWTRTEFIEKRGWDKMPGQEKAGPTVTRACADGLELLLNQEMRLVRRGAHEALRLGVQAYSSHHLSVPVLEVGLGGPGPPSPWARPGLWSDASVTCRINLSCSADERGRSSLQLHRYRFAPVFVARGAGFIPSPFPE